MTDKNGREELMEAVASMKTFEIVNMIFAREEKIRTCEFCGSKDLVCGKGWKDERDALKAREAKLKDELTAADSVIQRQIKQAVVYCEQNAKLMEALNIYVNGNPTPESLASARAITNHQREVEG